MAEKARCEDCDRTFKDLDGLRAHNTAKHGIEKKEEKDIKKSNFKIGKGWIIFILIILGLGVLIYWGLTSIETLPPTDFTGHVEESPQGHVLKEQMPIAIQKHMLEHSDGTGPPGIIINYNCEDYDCSEDLIESLEKFAEEFPVNVYVTPFKGMDAKIALTKYRKIEILEEFDEDKIRRFIMGR